MGPYRCGYDPRVCKIEGRYYVHWCNSYQGFPTIGLAVTDNFETFTQMENAYPPFQRNGVLFPRKINGLYYMLNRPSDNTHTRFGEIFVSASPDLTFWGKHRLVMRPKYDWESQKIGPGPTPIETTEGWLMIHHGVLNSCNGFTYAFGAALLDLEKPWKVIARCDEYLLAPHTLYECVGDVPNVAFPCAVLSDADTGRMAIYYGCADTCVSLCFAQVDELIDHIRKHAG
jgi:beta-1,4-mannooligosaccharide/beta-1,4-mannosyl-N-acetylglucosamine phosphorylase